MDLSNAFNNYCITCDKLVGPNFVYCTSQCREKDENQVSVLQRCNGDIVSPLLTPSLYQQSPYLPEGGSINLPLLLPESFHSEDVRDFSLNYSVSQHTSSQLKYGLSTSLNYRLWLTGVL